jgi:ferritin
MKLRAKIEDALNSQINQEMAAAYSYLAASAWFDENNLDGFAKWMELQRQEELEHASKLMDYLHDRGGKLILSAVEKPKAEFQSIMEVFQSALRSEENNTSSIHALYKLASDEDDYPTKSFLKWFICAIGPEPANGTTGARGGFLSRHNKTQGRHSPF